MAGEAARILREQGYVGHRSKVATEAKAALSACRSGDVLRAAASLLRGAAASCVEPLRSVYTFQACQTASLNPQEKTLPAQLAATAALLQAVWSRCGAFTPFRPAKRQAWTPKKRLCQHRCMAFASFTLWLLRKVYTCHVPAKGKLAPPRKETAGTVGGHGSAFASCAEPLRKISPTPKVVPGAALPRPQLGQGRRILRVALDFDEEPVYYLRCIQNW